MSLSTLDKIIAFESGDLSFYDTVNLFAELTKSGEVWRLQGMYGRTARAMISQGLINEQGDIIAELVNPHTCPHENLNVSEHRLNYVEDEEYVIVEFDYICADCSTYQSTIKSKYIFDSIVE